MGEANSMCRKDEGEKGQGKEGELGKHLGHKKTKGEWVISL